MVLNRIQVLQAHFYDKTVARKFDNLWCLFCDVSLGHEGEVLFFKAKAHVAKTDSSNQCRGPRGTPKQTLPLNKWRVNDFRLSCLCLSQTNSSCPYYVFQGSDISSNSLRWV